MKYYQVLPKYDNYRLPKMLIYIENELFTEKEVEKYGVNKKYCKEVEIPKNQTYWAFGARFA